MEIDVDDGQYKKLAEYSELAGVDFDVVVFEAFSEYIECVVSSRLEAISSRASEA